MKGKTVDGMYDNRHPSQFGSQTSYKSSLGIMGMDNVVMICFQEKGQVHKSQGVLRGVQGLNEIPERPDFHMVFLNQIYEPTSRCTGQFHFIDASIHPSHGKKGVDTRTAHDGKGMYVENLNHHLPKLRLSTP